MSSFASPNTTQCNAILHEPIKQAADFDSHFAESDYADSYLQCWGQHVLGLRGTIAADSQNLDALLSAETLASSVFSGSNCVESSGGPSYRPCWSNNAIASDTVSLAKSLQKDTEHQLITEPEAYAIRLTRCTLDDTHPFDKTAKGCMRMQGDYMIITELSRTTEQADGAMDIAVRIEFSPSITSNFSECYGAVLTRSSASSLFRLKSTTPEWRCS